MPARCMPGNIPAVIALSEGGRRVGPDKAKASGRAVIEQMKAIADRRSAVRQGRVRDGRPGDPRHVSVRGEVAGRVKRTWDYYS